MKKIAIALQTQDLNDAELSQVTGGGTSYTFTTSGGLQAAQDSCGGGSGMTESYSLDNFFWLVVCHTQS